MNNLSSRDKAFMYGILLLVFIVLGYFLGINNLNKKYKQYQTELQTLNERKAYLDNLIAENDTTTQEIEALNEQISDVELYFIDELDTECIEQYVMKTMEDAGSPYLSMISAEQVQCASTTYADGTISPDSLQCLRINVTYSSTDGYNVTQYNLNPNTTVLAVDPTAEEAVHEQMSLMGSEEYSQRVGYDEFLSALKTISDENPGCIKISSVSTESKAGFLLMSASIDFYGTHLTNRVSTDSSTDAYTSWQGDTDVNTDGGFIGYPYVVTDPNSLWLNVMNSDADCVAFIDRPFAPHWANAMFSIAAQQGGIEGITGMISNTSASTITPTEETTDGTNADETTETTAE